MVTFNIGSCSRRSHLPLRILDSRLPEGEKNRLHEFAYYFQRRTNGFSWVIKNLERAVGRWGLARPLSILDVSPDGGGFSCILAEWFLKIGTAHRLTYAPLSTGESPFVMERLRAIPMVCLELAGGSDPSRFGPHSFDVVTCFNGLEHFDLNAAVHFLRQVNVVACCGYFLAEWERDVRALLLVKGATLAGQGKSFSNDLTLAVKRSFTCREIKALAKDAGLEPVKIIRQSGLRLLTIGERRMEFSPEIKTVPGLAGT